MDSDLWLTRQTTAIKLYQDGSSYSNNIQYQCFCAPLFCIQYQKSGCKCVISKPHAQIVDFLFVCLDWTNLSGGTGCFSVKISQSSSVVMVRINTSFRPFLDNFRENIFFLSGTDYLQCYIQVLQIFLSV